MKRVTQAALDYGFTKCRKCELVLPLPEFGLKEVDSVYWRNVVCTVCLTPGMVREPPPKQSSYDGSKLAGLHHLGPAYHRNTEIIRMAKEAPCADCGRHFPTVCMDFDHRPGCGKEFVVARLRCAKEATLRAEIAKCDVVCACCHRIRTRDRKQSKGRPKASAVVSPALP